MLKDRTLVLYVHGKGGSAAEAQHYRPLFPDCDVTGLDYVSQTPWAVAEEFPAAFDRLAARYDRVVLLANSIGAYFSLCALPQQRLHRAYFISPIVDMEGLILNMMRWANVTEEALQAAGVISTDFGEDLSWEYLLWTRRHPVRWSVPTHILYGDRDHLTSKPAVAAFAAACHASLTIMENGEHWFHTPEQMDFLDAWLMNCENGKRGSV